MEEKKTFFSSQNPTLFEMINMILQYLLHQMQTVSLDLTDWWILMSGTSSIINVA